MLHDPTLFSEKESKTELITLRVTKREKDRITEMAGSRGVSAFILSLLDQENERQAEERAISIFDLDDGMSF